MYQISSFILLFLSLSMLGEYSSLDIVDLAIEYATKEQYDQLIGLHAKNTAKQKDDYVISYWQDVVEDISNSTKYKTYRYSNKVKDFRKRIATDDNSAKNIYVIEVTVKGEIVIYYMVISNGEILFLMKK